MPIIRTEISKTPMFAESEHSNFRPNAPGSLALLPFGSLRSC